MSPKNPKNPSKPKTPDREAEIPPLRLRDKNEMVKAIKESFDVSTAVKKAFDDRLSQRMPALKKAFQRAKGVFDEFVPSKVSAEARSRLTYLSSKDKLSDSLQTIMSEDLSSADGAKGKRKIRARLSKANLVDLGIGDYRGTEIVELPMSRMIDFTDAIWDRVDLTGFWNRHCKAEIAANSLLDEILAQPGTGGGSGTPGTGGQPSTGGQVQTTQQLIEAKLNELVHDASSPETQVKYGRPDQKDVNDSAKSLELRGGPADVTAYHDFYDLQIAFRHVWTELFDERLQWYGELLYGSVYGSTQEFSEWTEKEKITTSEELAQFLKDLKATRASISGADDRYKEIVATVLPHLGWDQWISLDVQVQDSIAELAAQYRTGLEAIEKALDWLRAIIKATLQPQLDELKTKAQMILVSNVSETPKLSYVENVISELETLLSQPYAFKIFAPGSVNFGILLQYRQKWEPKSYQVGELVSTIPLAPKEVRKFSAKKVVKQTRSREELENALRVKKRESSDTFRDHAEIVQRAENKTSFQFVGEGGFNLGVANGSAKHTITSDSSTHSSQVKKGFREAVLKAAEEMKNETKLVVTTTTSEEVETTSSGEISNPNDELPVTYLMYELQRRYEVSEKIYKVTPVILVANNVPHPHEIDEDWLLRHDWILKRVILDDSFLPALDYLRESLIGDEVAIQVHRENWRTQLEVVRKITGQVSVQTEVATFAEKVMERAAEEYAESLTETDKGLFDMIDDFIRGSGDVDRTETIRVRKEIAEEGFRRSERRLEDLRSRLSAEVSALQKASDVYSAAAKEKFNKRTDILRLRCHIVQNIMYYMQAIWDHQPPDHRFLELYDKQILDVQPGPNMVATIEAGEADPFAVGESDEKVSSTIKVKGFDDVRIESKSLIEVADLDQVLGYKANYTMFPMKKNNLVTFFMMQDYIEINDVVRLRDPDDFGTYSLEELIDYIKCIHLHSPDALTDEVLENFRTLILKRLVDPLREKETVIVPTDSLYMEALPGKHPILEDFKLLHRAIDVKKVQAEVRHAELENVRLAARSLKGEYEDPDIEKKIVVEGSNANVIVTPD